MNLREKYRILIPAALILTLFLCRQSNAQQISILEREVNLSKTTGEIDVLLKELANKGNFTFTYTSRVDVHRIASVTQRRQNVANHLNDIFRFDSISFVEQNDKILLVPLNVKPPPASDYFSVTGIVIDARTRRPLPFATIFLLNRSTGTISNSSGRFTIKLKNLTDEDTLGVSFIGYKMQKYLVSAIDTGLLIVRLSSEMVRISEVIVKPLDPIYILTKAVQSIHDNFDKTAGLQTAFFRESTEQDGKNVSSSEAVINIYKEPYTSNRPDQVKLYKGRKSVNSLGKEYIDLIVQGGLFNNLQLDIVKNIPTFLDVDYFALYDYHVDRIIMHLDRPTYVITFDQKPDVKYPCYKGSVYIDVNSFAIVGASFGLNEKNLNYNTRDYIKKSPRTIRVNPTAAFYEVYYRFYENKWNLNYARSEIRLHIRQKKDNDQDKFNSNFRSVSEFVITGIDSSSTERFKVNEVSGPKDVLLEQIGEVDMSFWGDENIIITEEPIEKIILRIGRRNNIFSEEEIKLIKIEEEKDAMKEESSVSEEDYSGSE